MAGAVIKRHNLLLRSYKERAGKYAKNKRNFVMLKQTVIQRSGFNVHMQIPG